MWKKLGKAPWLFMLAILLLAGTTGASSRSIHPTRGVSVSPLTLPPDFSRFAGRWFAHGADLNLSKDGIATFQSRTYRWCGPGVAQPCDTIDNTSGTIQAGNHEQIKFWRTSGPVAYGAILASNFHPRGLAVTVALKPNNTLLYAGDTIIALLCGPDAPVGTCGA